MGLKPLEFSDCYRDSPYFREYVYEHEKELEKTNERIKGLTKECKNLLRAVDSLSKAQRSFCTVLNDFKLNYIGEIDMADEIEIADAFTAFASLIEKVEEARERMLEHAHIQLIAPLEKFRKVQIGGAKEEKRKYDEETRKYCSLLEKHLQLKNKTKDEALREADRQIEDEFKSFEKLAFDYVSKLQEVNETKKFEFVEILLTFIYGQKTFFHNCHENYMDEKSYLDGLNFKLQTIRQRYDITKEAAEDLKRKVEKQGKSGELQKTTSAREGYLFVQEKKHGGLVFSWTKHYCMYQKENKILRMIPYTQTMGKMSTETDTMVVTSCMRKATEPLDRRFCFEITACDRKDVITLQALTEEDRRCWLEVMDGKEPTYMESTDLFKDNASRISELGITFIKKCISAIEKMGLEEEGLYRVAGVSSKFNNLVKLAIDSKKADTLDLESEEYEHDLRTITSALKQYFRNLSEPILSYKQHEKFLEAVKNDVREEKIEALRSCVSKLPEVNYSTLKLLLQHLVRVAEKADKNRMQASNIGVVWGPTLMRPKEETMAALMNLKFQGLVVETLIQEYEKIFADDAGRKPTHELSVEKKDLSRSPNLLKKSNNPPANGPMPMGISNPAYISPISSKPVAQPRVPPSQKSYPAPPPPANKPALLPKKNRQSKLEESEFEDWTLVSEAGLNQSDDVPQVQRAVSSPVLNQQSDVPPKKAYSPKHRKDNKAAKPEPPPKRYVESVPGFTSVSKTNKLEEEDQDYENGNISAPKRSVSFENAMQLGQKPVIDLSSVRLTPIDSEKPQASNERKSQHPSSPPPPIPRRKEWKVRAIYNCVAENSSELSFSIGAVISNVKKSSENGWLVGTLNGRTGLLPINYVEDIEQG